MESVKTFLEHKDDNFKWQGTFEDLKKLVKLALKLPEEENGEVNEDKLHKAFTFRIGDVSVRYYSTTGNIKVQGKDYMTLRDRLLELLEINEVSEVNADEVNADEPNINIDESTDSSTEEKTTRFIVKKLAQKLEKLSNEVVQIKQAVNETKNPEEIKEILKKSKKS